MAARGPGGLGQVSTYTSEASAADFDADVWSIESSRLTDFNGDGLADVVSGGFGSSYCTSCASSNWSVRYKTVDYATGAHAWAATPTYFSGPTAAVSEVDVDDVNKKMRPETASPRPARRPASTTSTPTASPITCNPGAPPPGRSRSAMVAASRPR